MGQHSMEHGGKQRRWMLDGLIYHANMSQGNYQDLIPGDTLSLYDKVSPISQNKDTLEDSGQKLLLLPFYFKSARQAVYFCAFSPQMRDVCGKNLNRGLRLVGVVGHKPMYHHFVTGHLQQDGPDKCGQALLREKRDCIGVHERA